jgi:hypothetical protein
LLKLWHWQRLQPNQLLVLLSMMVRKKVVEVDMWDLRACKEEKEVHCAQIQVFEDHHLLALLEV